MRIGDEIIRQITATMNSVDDQFRVLDHIEEFDPIDQNPIQLLQRIAKTLPSALGVQSVLLSYRVDKNIVQYGSFPTQQAEKNNSISARTIEKSLKKPTVQEGQVCFTIEVDVEFAPSFYLTLVDFYFGRKTSTVFDKDTRLFLKSLGEKLSKRLSTAQSELWARLYQNLSSQFLLRYNEAGNGMADLENGEDAKSHLDNEGWGLILETIASLVPNYEPFSFPSDFPKWQILTIEKGRKYLNLRAELSSLSEDAGSQPKESQTFLTRRLETRKTVSGLVVENEDKGVNRPYLLCNPAQDHTIRGRFASTMWSDLPKSELIIPIIGAGGRAIAIINVEHKEENAFSLYHVDCIQKASGLVANFAQNIIDTNKMAADSEKELRYLLFRIINKLSEQYQHRTKNEFGSLMSAMVEAQSEVGEVKEAIDSERELRDLLIQTTDSLSRQIQHKTKNEFAALLSSVERARSALKEPNLAAIEEELNEATEITKVLKDSALGFQERAKDFVRYGEYTVHTMLKDVVRDSQRAAASLGNGVNFSYVEQRDVPTIFCSGMLAEHIYSIIQNSIENFEEQRKLGVSIPEPTIEVTVDVRPGETDRLGQVLSSGFVDISILDNGGGLPEKTRRNPFKLGLSSKAQGNGSGLATALRYMHRIGGDVKLVDEPSQGVKVSIRAPAYADELHDGMAEELNLISE